MCVFVYFFDRICGYSIKWLVCSNHFLYSKNFSTVTHLQSRFSYCFYLRKLLYSCHAIFAFRVVIVVMIEAHVIWKCASCIWTLYKRCVWTLIAKWHLMPPFDTREEIPLIAFQIGGDDGQKNATDCWIAWNLKRFVQQQQQQKTHRFYNSFGATTFLLFSLCHSEMWVTAA